MKLTTVVRFYLCRSRGVFVDTATTGNIAVQSSVDANLTSFEDDKGSRAQDVEVFTCPFHAYLGRLVRARDIPPTVRNSLVSTCSSERISFRGSGGHQVVDGHETSKFALSPTQSSLASTHAVLR